MLCELVRSCLSRNESLCIHKYTSPFESHQSWMVIDLLPCVYVRVKRETKHPPSHQHPRELLSCYSILVMTTMTPTTERTCFLCGVRVEGALSLSVPVPVHSAVLVGLLIEPNKQHNAIHNMCTPHTNSILVLRRTVYLSH